MRGVERLTDLMSSAKQNGQTVVIFGATGNAGSGALHAALSDPRVSEVRAVTRRSLGISNERLSEILWSDFTNLTGIGEHLRGVDCCLFCLGTSVRNVQGEDEYREIHVAYPLAAAKTLLQQSPDSTFVYLSGAGTNRKSRMMWARVKAEAEDALAALPLRRLANVRPAGILPMRPTGTSRWLLAPLIALIPRLGIRSIEFGRAALQVALDQNWSGVRTVENADLKRAAADSPARA